MGSEWPTVTLNDVCETITDGAHNSPAEDPTGLPMASVKDLTRHGIDLGGCRRISRYDFDTLKRQGCMPRQGDVLIAKDGNSALDTVCVHRLGEEVVLLSSVAILRPNHRVDPDFLRYYLDSPVTRNMLKAGFRSGSAIPRVILRDFKRAPMPLPTLLEQREISRILSSLDDKIELNRHMSQTLESMARALFKSWFIDFDPVRAKAQGRDTGLPSRFADLFPNALQDSELGDIPKGWEIHSFGDHVANHDSKRVPLASRQRELRPGPYPYHGAAGIMDHIDNYLFDGVFLLVGEDGSVVTDGGTAVTQYVWGRFWVNNHAHVLQGRGAVSTEQLYLYLGTEQVAPYVTGAVQPKLSQGRMNSMPFLFPGERVCRAFAEFTFQAFRDLRAHMDSLATESALRDALLPWLISGHSRLKGERWGVGHAM